MEDSIEFFYKPFPTLRDPERPVAEVFIKYKKNVRKVICLIDSGADQCTFPIDFAISLGIDLKELYKNPVPTGCACGKTIIHYHYPVDIEIGGHTVKNVMVAWIPPQNKEEIIKDFKKAGYTKKQIEKILRIIGKYLGIRKYEEVSALLGRKVIFDKFKVLFTGKKIIFSKK